MRLYPLTASVIGQPPNNSPWPVARTGWSGPRLSRKSIRGPLSEEWASSLYDQGGANQLAAVRWPSDLTTRSAFFLRRGKRGRLL